ncbi:6272_t:CDS:2 [Gigaspora margarita]|uniref:6272_t:CDS:1 n=1 Tax=Gigaspora margarita TaxID=4874 RepID=A0ABN7V170_GIGMA|nr:6272_t:CDS:2 [Gigaspora margarita]
MTYNEDILANCQELFLNLISTQTKLKELELNYFSTSSFISTLRQEMLQTKSQSLRKLILQGIKFNKDNLANLKELSNEVKEEFIFLLSQNYPNIITLYYMTNNLMFSSALKKLHKLCQLQIGGFAYYHLPYSSQDYLQALIRYLPSSLKILSLLDINDYQYENLNCFLQDFDIERIKLEVFILPFNVELDLFPNLKKFIEKAKYLRYLKIVRSENYNIKKQKSNEREIINLCQVRNVKCILKF